MTRDEAPEDQVSTEIARVVVIEDETLAREFLSTLCGGDFRVIATYADVESYLAGGLPAEVVVLDLWIRPQRGPRPPLRGLAAIRAISSRGPRILIYSSERRREVLAQLVRAGAQGVVTKFEPVAALTDAISRIAGGEVVLTTELVGLADVLADEGLVQLTPRQATVLRCRAQGLGADEVASRLFISVSAVEKATTQIYQRFATYLKRVSPNDLNGRPPRSAALLAALIGYGPDDLLDPYS